MPLSQIVLFLVLGACMGVLYALFAKDKILDRLMRDPQNMDRMKFEVQTMAHRQVLWRSIVAGCISVVVLFIVRELNIVFAYL